MKIHLYLFSVAFVSGITLLPALHAQAPREASEIKAMIATYKKDDRGPYRDIRWFCPDGSTLPPQERCKEKGGVQRARYKDDVIALGNSNHIFLGQILSTTPFVDFWDASHANSRLKQYQLERFLKAADNGWVNRRAQYYRGAVQVEDEDKWGLDFYRWILDSTAVVNSQFFLLRQSAIDLPHMTENNTTQNVRAISREIAESYPPFMDLRVKLHGNPEPGDIARVRDFRENHRSRLSAELNNKFDVMLADMETMYKPLTSQEILKMASALPSESKAADILVRFGNGYSQAMAPRDKCFLIAETAIQLREAIAGSESSPARLSILDISNTLESALTVEAAEWNPSVLKEQMSKTICLAEAAFGFGYIESWEWEQLSTVLRVPASASITLGEFSTFVDYSRRVVEWGTGMVRATYDDVVNEFLAFEPLATGFMDDRIRSSVLLQLGSSTGKLGNIFAQQAGFANNIMDVSNPSSARGLNPGYAMGELVVTNQAPDQVPIDGSKIYIFNRPPADLKPVAGIATVTEGNAVSHVQLLARNLGIPNAVLTMENLKELLPYDGVHVFYAVSPGGTVILKPVIEMTEEERALFRKITRSEEKITIDEEEIQIDIRKVLNLRDINAAHSGTLCGPKAANLGQLKLLFPENVVEGLVIPFGVFRYHMEQQMPGETCSYWQFLEDVFEDAATRRQSGEDELSVEQFVINQLQVLRQAIREMPLDSSLINELDALFPRVLGKPLGQIPVFLRSDTNMEDLKDFTGAGLNLTLFNVLDRDKILQGIKDVWASPYTERSYKWRQRYLLNPENVYPSILIIPSVNVDYSGVMITQGVGTGGANDITVAFNRGVGGAVEGQVSETWLMASNGNRLLSPAREPEYTVIPSTGGTKKAHTTFSNRILTEKNLASLRHMAGSVKQKLPDTGVKGPYDIELGFRQDHVWLFQVRPFVENKKATASLYLKSITPAINSGKQVPVYTPIQ